MSNSRYITFSVEKPNNNQLFYSIGITLLLIVIRQLFSSSLDLEEHPVETSMSITQQLLFIVILASLSEELLFRGFLQNILSPLKSYGIRLFNLRLSAPVLVSGGLFGLIHFALVSTGASLTFVILIVLSAIVVGLIAGYFQEKNNNFSYAFIVHLTANLAGLIISIL